MSQNKLKLTITRDTSNGWYKVEMRDMYDDYCCVYEQSVSMAMNYAENWFAEAEERYKANQIHAKAVHEMAKLDRELGIVKGNYDGLD